IGRAARGWRGGGSGASSLGGEAWGVGVVACIARRSCGVRLTLHSRPPQARRSSRGDPTMRPRTCSPSRRDAVTPADISARADVPAPASLRASTATASPEALRPARGLPHNGPREEKDSGGMNMNDRPSSLPAGSSGTVRLGGEVTVNRLGFGAMRITGDGVWGPPKDPDSALAVLRRATQLGVNFIDTADSYGPYVSEELIAKALAPYPEGLVIATKGGWNRPGPGQWTHDASPEHLRKAVEGSLKRLRLERIDVYQLHIPDPVVPFDASVEALAGLRAEGKIRFVALSNVTQEHIERARKIVPIVS